MDRTRSRLASRLRGLTDGEPFWEPVPGCWTVHRRGPGDRHRAPGVDRFVNGRCEWVLDYAIPDPDPAPFTTIAWRLVHISHITAMYDEHVFGPGELDFDDFEIPHTAGPGCPGGRRASRRTAPR